MYIYTVHARRTPTAGVLLFVTLTSIVLSPDVDLDVVIASQAGDNLEFVDPRPPRVVRGNSRSRTQNEAPGYSTLL